MTGSIHSSVANVIIKIKMTRLQAHINSSQLLLRKTVIMSLCNHNPRDAINWAAERSRVTRPSTCGLFTRGPLLCPLTIIGHDTPLIMQQQHAQSHAITTRPIHFCAALEPFAFPSRFANRAPQIHTIISWESGLVKSVGKMYLSDHCSYITIGSGPQCLILPEQVVHISHRSRPV